MALELPSIYMFYDSIEELFSFESCLFNTFE